MPRFGLMFGLAVVATGSAGAAETVRTAKERFADLQTRETPDFQQHVLPVLGKLGCNGRACHGSFQGAGGFRLSLFGYDFKADHDALLKGESPRVDREVAADSRMLRKPTLAIPHKGGKKLEPNSWEYRLLLRWVQAGAKTAAEKARFHNLEVTPSEIVFTKPGETKQIKVIAHWSDGNTEDVTCISRFRTNDESIATIDSDGLVKCVGKGDTHVVAFYDNGVKAVSTMLPVSEFIGPNYPEVATPTKIDRLVVDRLRKIGVVQSETCTDLEFLRRLSLDLTATLPTPAEIEAFAKDKDPEKRSKKIEELMKRPTYTAWWTTKLCDQTGQNIQTLLEGAPQMRAPEYKGWYDWIHKRVGENMPYDKIIEGVVLAVSREDGQSYQDYIAKTTSIGRGEKKDDFANHKTMPFFWARRITNTPNEKALNFAYAFLGVRLQCAECHKHPFDQWTQQDFQQFTAFFNNVRYGLAPDAVKQERELTEKYGLNDKKANAKDRNQLIKEIFERGDPLPLREVFVAQDGRGKSVGKGAPKGKAGGRVLTPKVLGGEEVVSNNYKDPREPLMEWLRSRDNPYFAKSFVNRVWANYFNVGIVDPPDDMNLASPPSNEALLDYLAEGFAEHGYDMKWLHREICNSRTYQLSSRTNETNYLDNHNFSHAVVRRLPAEVALDAISFATGNAQEHTRFETDPMDRAIGTIVPAGKGGRRGPNDYALRIFGKPERVTTCDCERANDPTLVQSLYLRNDQEVTNLLNRKEGWLASVALASGQRVDGTPTPVAKPTKPAKGAKGERPQPTLEERLVAQENRLKKLKQAPKPNEKAIRATEQEIASLRTKVAAERKAASAKPVAPVNVKKWIHEAYVRTVSRPPTSQEVVIAEKYIRESKSPVAGLRDVLWALINTKEFITNH